MAHLGYSNETTSKAAAESLAEHADTQREKVLSAIEGAGKKGMTDDEVEQALGMRHQTASARRRGLVIDGLVVDSGRTRKTRSGRAATVWVKAPEQTDIEEVIRVKRGEARARNLRRARALLRKLDDEQLSGVIELMEVAIEAASKKAVDSDEEVG